MNDQKLEMILNNLLSETKDKECKLLIYEIWNRYTKGDEE